MDLLAIGQAKKATKSSVSGWKSVELNEQTGEVTAVSNDNKTYHWSYPIPKDGSDGVNGFSIFIAHTRRGSEDDGYFIPTDLESYDRELQVGDKILFSGELYCVDEIRTVENTPHYYYHDGPETIKGTDGFSPLIEVKEDTDNSYILKITDKIGSFDTPNLKGSGGGSGGTLNYNDLYNKPSINGIDLEGALNTEDLNLLTEEAVENIVNSKTSDFATRSEIPENVSDLNNDSNFITRSDFANSTEAGTVKANATTFDLNVNQNGELYPNDLSFEQYNSKSSYSFISKGTLEKVITGKKLTNEKYVQDYVSKHGGGGTVDAEMSDTSENAVQNKIIKGYIDDGIQGLNKEIEGLELYKTPNATIIGIPTINNGQISGFNANNYLRFPFVVDLTGKTFEINIEVTTSSDVSTQQNIFDSEFGFAFAIRNSRLVIALSSNGATWDLGEKTGVNPILPNTSYRFKIIWDKNTYKVSASTNGGESYIDDIIFDSTSSLYPKQIYIGVGINQGVILNSFSGIINLNNCNLYLNDLLKWQGMDSVGIASRLATDLSNVDSDGEQKIKDIAGSGGTSNYNELLNKPKINEIELMGNISSDELGIIASMDYEYSSTDEKLKLFAGQGGSSTPIELTEEHLTGELFNGKPVYKKVVTATYNTLSTAVVVTDSDLANIDTLVFFHATFKLSDKDGIVWNEMPLGNGSQIYRLERITPQGGIRMFAYNMPSWGNPPYTLIATLKYTKSTD